MALGERGDALWQASARRVDPHWRVGAPPNRCQMKSILQMDPRMRELVMLSALAALGCVLAAVQGDLVFVAIFGVTCAVTIIEAIRRLQ
jgi:alkylhydroperoxidase/carboxymuconolactone decarboxylase family protein YurZ